MVRLLGPGHATECTTVVAVLVESAAVYATFSLLFLIPFALNNPVSYAFLQVLGEAQVSHSVASWSRGDSLLVSGAHCIFAAGF